MTKSPYVPFATEITGAWPARALKTRDEPNEVIRVLDGRKLLGLADLSKVERAVSDAETARIYLRYTQAMTYAVVLEFRDDGPTRVWYGSAGGYGYDRVAAALAGCQIAPGLILTDHCGLDRFDHPYEGRREIIVHRGGSLPAPYFTL